MIKRKPSNNYRNHKHTSTGSGTKRTSRGRGAACLPTPRERAPSARATKEAEARSFAIPPAFRRQELPSAMGLLDEIKEDRNPRPRFQREVRTSAIRSDLPHARMHVRLDSSDDSGDLRYISFDRVRRFCELTSCIFTGSTR